MDRVAQRWESFDGQIQRLFLIVRIVIAKSVQHQRYEFVPVAEVIAIRVQPQKQRFELVVSESQSKLVQNFTQLVRLHFRVCDENLMELLDLDGAQLFVKPWRIGLRQ